MSGHSQNKLTRENKSAVLDIVPKGTEFSYSNKVTLRFYLWKTQPAMLVSLSGGGFNGNNEGVFFYQKTKMVERGPGIQMRTPALKSTL